MRALLAMLAVLLALSALPGSALTVNLQFEGRTFLEETPPGLGAPASIQVVDGLAGIGVVYEDPGSGLLAGSKLYIVDLSSLEVLANYYYEGERLLCVSRYGDSFDAVLYSGAGRVREEIVTRDLERVEGFTYRLSHPSIPSGCTRGESEYYIFGSAVVRGRGLENIVEAISDTGRRLWVQVWGSNTSDETVIDLQVAGRSVLAISLNQSDPRGTVAVYRVLPESVEPVLNITGYTYVSASARGDRLVIVLKSIGSGGYAIAVYNATEDRGVLLQYNTTLGIPVYAEPFNDNLVAVAGYHLNLTRAAIDGMVALIDATTGRVVTVDYAMGKRNTTYTILTPLATGASKRLVVAGSYGGVPLLAVYGVREAPEHSGGGGEQTLPRKEASWFPPAAWVVSIAVGVVGALLAVWWWRTRRAHPATPHPRL